MTKIKGRFEVTDFIAEEQWLNEKATAGLLLVRNTFSGYVFDDVTPGKYVIRIQYLGRNRAENQEFLQKADDSGAQRICIVGNKAYYQKEGGNSGFQLPEKKAAQLAYLKALRFQYTFLAIAEGLLTASNLWQNWLSGDWSTVNAVLSGMLVLITAFCVYYALKIHKIYKKAAAP